MFYIFMPKCPECQERAIIVELDDGQALCTCAKDHEWSALATEIFSVDRNWEPDPE